MKKTEFIYDAIVRSIYDGDTMRIDIDLGCSTWVGNEPVRLRGLDAPEVRGVEREAGLAARDWLRWLLPEGTNIVVVTQKDDRGKYGRYVVDVYKDDVHVNQALIDAGHAVAKEY